jgi:hypothetical protein
MVIFNSNGFGQVVFNQIGEAQYGDNDYDSYGQSVSINGEGNIIAAGAPYYSNIAIRAGQVKVYEEMYGEWFQKGSDILGSVVEDGLGWSVSLNDAGDIIAIGLPYNQEAGSSYGKVLVFHYVNDDWEQLGDVILGESAGELAGWTVSINTDGYTLAVGAIEAVDDDVEEGLIRVYEYDQNNDTWVKFGNDMKGNTIGSNFGYSLDINDDGTIVAAGACTDNANGENSGIVKIYEKSNDDWVQKGQTLNGNISYQFGWRLSLNGNGSKIAVGSNRANNDNGLVQVFTFNDGNWAQLGNNIEGDDNNAGASVSLNSEGNIVSIGFSKGVSQGEKTGMLKVFKLNSDSWEQHGPALYGTNDGDRYGSGTALNNAGDIFIVAAESDSELGPFRGKTETYQIEDPNGITTPEINISIAPNPFTEYLKINSPKEIHHVIIYDFLGRKVFENNYHGKKTITLSVPMLKLGIYFINFDDNGQSLISKKIVKL